MLPQIGRDWLRRVTLAAAALLMLLPVTVVTDAHAATEAYTVRDLPIDAQAKSANAARNRAIANGQREAYQMMLSRVVLGDEAARLPPLDDTAINALIEGFEIADERVAPTRYRANLTVAFNETLVRAMLRENGVRFVEGAGRPVVVIPILMTEDGPRLWQDDNLWLRAWSLRDKPPGLTPIIVPLGDTSDIAELDARAASGTDLQPLLRFAKRYGAEEALVLEARRLGNALQISGRHIVGGSVTAFADEVLGIDGQGSDAVFSAGTDRVVERLDADVKSTAVLRSGTVNTVRAVAPVQSLAEWISLRATVAGLPAVESIEVIALSRSGADIMIRYFGDAAQLDSALAEHNLVLRPNGTDGGFVLAPRQSGSSVVGSLARSGQG